MKPTVEILSVGNEILRGSVVNTNAAFLGRELSTSGFDVVAQSVCPDSQEAIRFRLGEAIRRADVVFMMGGIGPTPDDVTREGVAAHFNVPLVFSKTEYRRIQKIYKRFGKRVPAIVRREAFYPANAKPLVNRFGMAMGFSIELQRKLVIALPGVPSELQNMYFDVVLPLLKKKYPESFAAQRLVVKMTGISEPDVMKRLGKDFFDDHFDFGIYPSAGEVAIRISTDRLSVCRKLRRKIRARLHDFIYASEEVPLTAVIGKILVAQKRTLAVAESCTGGLLASKITKDAGASVYFRGGTVAYHRIVKTKLGVPEKMIKVHGEVSSQVASAMAESVCGRMEASYGIGITGIAGPTGGSAKKPVGLVYIGLALAGKKPQVWRHVFLGDRSQIQNKAAVKALEYLWRKIR